MLPANLTDSSELFETQELSAVTNLSGEYGIRIEAGDDYRVSAPSNWDSDDFAIACWFQPDWDHNDGESHRLLRVQVDSSNRALDLYKHIDGSIRAFVNDGAVQQADPQLTKSFSAGDSVFVGVRLNGGTITLYADTDSDGTLETSSGNGVTTGSGSYTIYVGHNSTGETNLEGAVNALITNDGSSDDAIQDRYNGGDGMALSDWLATENDGAGSGKVHAENLVLHVGGNSDGSAVQMDSYASATDLLTDANDGGYDFGGSGDRINYGNATDLDGATKAWFLFEFEPDTLDSAYRRIFARQYTSVYAQKQIACFTDGGAVGYLRFAVATDLVGGQWVGSTANSFMSAGGRYLGLLRIDLDAGTIHFDYKTYDSATRAYSASWTSNDPSMSGTAPSAFTTPSSATDFMLGTSSDVGTSTFFDGKLYGFRWAAGQTLTDAQRDALELDQAYHDQCDHAYYFEGDATDQIGALDGTITGATSVSDGRSQSGRFERYTRQGRYNADGVDDTITTADPGAGADSIAAATWQTFREFDDVAAGEQILLGRWDGADNQFQVVRNGGDIRVYVASSGTDASNYADFTVGIAAGDIYDLAVVYDGSLAAGSRIALHAKKYDPTTGTWGAQSSPAATVTGTVPASLRASALGYTLLDAGFNGKLDEDRINEGTALTAATLDGETIYSRTDANWTHAYPYDSNANDAIGALDGTVSGAQQVADGRQPVGWTLAGTSFEGDRATSSNDKSEGLYGLRYKNVSGVGFPSASQSTVSLTASQWVFVAAKSRSSSSYGQIKIERSGNVAFQNAPVQATVGVIAGAGRISATGTGTVKALVSDGAGAEAYFDDLRAYELATVSASTATKALPTRVLFSVSDPGNDYPYIAVALAGDESVEAWARNDSGTQYGPSGGDTANLSGWHTVGFGYDGTDYFVTVDGVPQATTVSLSGTFDNLSETTIGAIRLAVAAHFAGLGANIDLGRVIVWDEALGTQARKDAHNLLRDTYTSLSEAT